MLMCVFFVYSSPAASIAHETDRQACVCGIRLQGRKRTRRFSLRFLVDSFALSCPLDGHLRTPLSTSPRPDPPSSHQPASQPATPTGLGTCSVASSGRPLLLLLLPSSPPRQAPSCSLAARSPSLSLPGQAPPFLLRPPPSRTLTCQRRDASDTQTNKVGLALLASFARS